MAIRDLLLSEFDQEMANTRKVLALYPETKTTFKPHEKSMPLNHLAGHVAEMPGWIPMTMQMDVLDFDPNTFVPFAPNTTAELLSKFDENVKSAREALATATDEQFGQTWTMKINGTVVVSLPRYTAVRSFVLNHVIHHRAQLGVYFRLNNIPIPGLYGPSADEPQNFTAQSA